MIRALIAILYLFVVNTILSLCFQSLLDAQETEVPQHQDDVLNLQPALQPEKRKQQEQAVTAKLAFIRDQQRALQTQQESTNTAVQAAHKQLREDDLMLSKMSQDLQKLKLNLANLQEQHAQLLTQEKTLNTKIAPQKQIVAKLLQAVYMLGKNYFWRIVWMPEELPERERQLAYYRYFSHYVMVTIEQINLDLQQLAEVKKQITIQQDLLQKQLQEQQIRQQILDEARQKHQVLLDEIQQQLAAQHTQLQNLQRNEKQLNQLLQLLADAIADVPKQIQGGQSFQTLRGKLPWPVDNVKLRIDPKTPSALWFDAQAGTAVKAVAHGRVAYADWLKGYGLLIIIEHGDGFMSLYGQNEALLCEVGDWVDTGDKIAAVGQSGGGLRSALYFELRAKGKSLDERQWLHKAGVK